MPKIVFRGRSDPGDPDAYWRRRFFILGGGLAVLMLVAWLFGGGGPSRQESLAAAARSSAAAREARGSLPSAAYGTPYGAQPSLSSSASGSPSASPTPSPSASPSASAPVSASASASASAAAAAAKASGQCPAANVVLSLFTSQPSYSPGQQPKFNVYAVSTSASSCQLKYGPAVVRVVVTRKGKVVWDSAVCKTAHQGASMVRLAPGVPQQVALAWNREATARSCAGTLSPGTWGTFEAVAQADGHSSSRSFKLSS